MDLQLNGKRALVTGSSAGIGEAIAKTLAAEGVKVVVNGRNTERAERVAEAIRGSGGEAAVAVGDLSSDDGASDVVERALNAFGGLEIVVNNAGGYEVSDWESATPERWAAVYNQNVVSMVRVIRGTLESVKSGGWGRFIQISSGIGTAPFPGMADYAATKAANTNMSLSLAKALAGTGVTSNTLSPGAIRTSSATDIFAQFVGAAPGDEAERAFVETMLAQQPTPRLGEPEEIAAAVAFLASPLANYINGQNLRVDGGFVATVN